MASNDPAILAENFYNIAQFPLHTVVANEEATNHEALRAGRTSRSAEDYWAATTANQIATLDVDCVTDRAATACFLDRGHNLSGKQILLQGDEFSDYSTATTVFTCTIPASVSSAADFDLSGSANGVHTYEGAWCVRFPTATFRHWRLKISASVGLTPQVVGLYLGTTWEPGEFLRPLIHENTEVMGTRTITSLGWQGAVGQRIRRRRGEFGLKLKTSALDAAALAAVAALSPRPFWLIHDADVTERAVLALRNADRQGLQRGTDWFHLSGQISWAEFQPLVT